MKCFLSECIHLAEYNRMLGLGREFPTNVGDLSLKKMINEFGRMRQALNGSSDNFRVNTGLENTDPFKTPSANTICSELLFVFVIVNFFQFLIMRNNFVFSFGFFIEK